MGPVVLVEVRRKSIVASSRLMQASISEFFARWKKSRTEAVGKSLPTLVFDTKGKGLGNHSPIDVLRLEALRIRNILLRCAYSMDLLEEVSASRIL
jgi:hypothetical protein